MSQFPIEDPTCGPIIPLDGPHSMLDDPVLLAKAEAIRVKESELNPEPFDEELALAEMLIAGKLFANDKQYSNNQYDRNDITGRTIVLFVNCSDMFAWGCADAEDLPYTEIKSLYEWFKKNATWGTVIWCMKQRNEKPQRPVVEAMVEEKAWEPWMDALPQNQYDLSCKRWMEQKNHIA